MSINNLQHFSTDELLKQFKEATLQGKPPQEIVNELPKRPGIVLINATDSAKVTIGKAQMRSQKAKRAIAHCKFNLSQHT